MIVVSPTKTLRGLRGVELVPFRHGRFLIALDDGMSEPQLELAVREALDGDTVPETEHALLERLAAMLQEARHAGTLVLRRIMVLHATAAVPATRRSRRKTRKRHDGIPNPALVPTSARRVPNCECLLGMMTCADQSGELRDE